MEGFLGIETAVDVGTSAEVNDVLRAHTLLVMGVQLQMFSNSELCKVLWCGCKRTSSRLLSVFLTFPYAY